MRMTKYLSDIFITAEVKCIGLGKPSNLTDNNKEISFPRKIGSHNDLQFLKASLIVQLYIIKNIKVK